MQLNKQAGISFVCPRARPRIPVFKIKKIKSEFYIRIMTVSVAPAARVSHVFPRLSHFYSSSLHLLEKRKKRKTNKTVPEGEDGSSDELILPADRVHQLSVCCFLHLFLESSFRDSWVTPPLLIWRRLDV